MDEFNPNDAASENSGLFGLPLHQRTDNITQYMSYELAIFFAVVELDHGLSGRPSPFQSGSNPAETLFLAENLTQTTAALYRPSVGSSTNESMS